MDGVLLYFSVLFLAAVLLMLLFARMRKKAELARQLVAQEAAQGYIGRWHVVKVSLSQSLCRAMVYMHRDHSEYMVETVFLFGHPDLPRITNLEGGSVIEVDAKDQRVAESLPGTYDSDYLTTSFVC